MSTITDKHKSVSRKTVKCLKLISGAETLTLDATDGKATIAKAGNVFTGYLDSDFKNCSCDVESSPTGKQAVKVYEMDNDSTLVQVYDELGDNLDALCLSQGQITQFVEKYWTKGYNVYFLFKVDNDFFVTYVWELAEGSLVAYMFKPSNGDILRAEDRPRFVIPQLAPQAA